MKKDLSIHSIYPACEGEGVWIGTPLIFIRLQGCRIGCVNCDSKETWAFKNPTHSNEEIIQEVERLGSRFPRVSITGGDPLDPQHREGLLGLLKKMPAKFFVNIEVTGMRFVPEVFDLVNFISMDFKTPSTQVRGRWQTIVEAAPEYAKKMQVKGVIAHRQDFEAFYEAKKKVEEKMGETSFPWVLTPAYEPHEAFPQKRFQEVVQWSQEYAEEGFRVIAQQHKWIYPLDNFLV